MLLESPKTRFHEDKLWLLRHRANLAIRDKSNQHYPLNGRDQGYKGRSLIERRRNRKMIGASVSSVLKEQQRDELLRIARINNAVTSMFGGTIDAADRIVSEKYGANVRALVMYNHKSSWIPPVWLDESWYQSSPYCFYHDVHQSEDDPTQIAYNRSVDGIKRNIQTRTRPGKYLTQFFSNVLSESDIKYWAERQVAAATCVAELKFIENDDPDGWVEVYENGPQSCMRGSRSVKVYALPGNGLRLAYLEADDQIVARSIVVDATNDDKVKGWVRIYSTEQRWETSMLQMLIAAGYDTRTNMNGVKIKLIDAGHRGFVCPYIDYGEGGEQTVSADESKGVLIIGGGDWEATCTDGYVNGGYECDECGADGLDEDDVTYVESTEQNLCSDCLDNHFTYAYGSREWKNYYPEGECIYCESDSEWYHQDHYAKHDIMYVESRDAYYHIDDCVCCDVGKREGEWVHINDFDTDHISGEIAHEDEFVNIYGKSVHESYVVSCYVSGDDVDMRECVEINLHTKHMYPYSSFYTKPVNLYIHQDNLTAEVILSDFVQCGDLLLTSDYYGNPVTCCAHSNLTYGTEYTGDRIEDLLVADAEERLVDAEVREIFSLAA